MSDVWLIIPCFNESNRFSMGITGYFIEYAPDGSLYLVDGDSTNAPRILGKCARLENTPFYKYITNRVLTFVKNLLVKAPASGNRTFSREILAPLPVKQNSDDFISDNQTLCQTFYMKSKIDEGTYSTRYEKESSSINFVRSYIYGISVLKCSLVAMLHRLDVWESPLLEPLDKSRNK
nr:hypothetical protein [uncultured Pseudodesulfovibrio sp.]